MSLSTFELTNGDRELLLELLWGYRHGLLRVEALLEAQVLLATAGRDDQLGVMADLLEETAAQIGRLDLRREMIFDPAAAPDGPPTLRELAGSVDDTWSEMLHDHHRWFEASVARIQQLTDQSRHLQDSTLRLIAQAVGAASESTVTGYDRTGDAVRSSPGAALFDGRM